jgi:hypothetical protein
LQILLSPRLILLPTAILSYLPLQFKYIFEKSAQHSYETLTKRRIIMKNDKSKNDNQLPKIRNAGDYPKSRDTGYTDAIPGINTPGIELPAFNPPVPNRAWTAMRMGLDIDELSDEEKRDMYYGKD